MPGITDCFKSMKEILPILKLGTSMILNILKTGLCF